MAVTLAQLEAYRERLLDAKFSGVRQVRDSNGDEVTYRSQTELDAAINSLDAEIRNLTGGHRPSTVKFQTSKGL